MAAILYKAETSLFISYAPGTGSTSLEQFIRTYQHVLESHGLEISHYPKDEFASGIDITRHVCYSEYKSDNNSATTYVATGIRHPGSYYYSEYLRLRTTDWISLLDDKESWLYHPRSKSTLDLIKTANEINSFDLWFMDILKAVEQKGYLAINEDHLEGSTHHIKTESIYDDLCDILAKVLDFKLDNLGLTFPCVNKNIGIIDTYEEHISQQTKNLANNLLYDYLYRFNYKPF